MFTATADIRGPLADVSLSRSALIEMSFCICHPAISLSSALLLCCYATFPDMSGRFQVLSPCNTAPATPCLVWTE